MPRPLAYAILAVIGAAIAFGVITMLRQTKAHHAAERPAPTAAAQPAAPAAPAPGKS